MRSSDTILEYLALQSGVALRFPPQHKGRSALI
jgi:hypothetical protein